MDIYRQREWMYVEGNNIGITPSGAQFETKQNFTGSWSLEKRFPNFVFVLRKI
jgi:hypothetical protein